MKDEIKENKQAYLEIKKGLHGAIGAQAAYIDCTCECLLASKFKDGAKLVQIEQHGAFDVATFDLPIRVIGSGQLQADPFSVFLRKTFWPNRLPTVNEGVLCAVWAIDYAIEVGAKNVGAGINAYTVTERNSRAEVKQLSEDQIKEDRDFIREAKKQLRSLADLRVTTTADAKRIPTME